MALHSKCLGPTGQARRVCGWHSRPPLLPCIVSARQPRNLAACAQTQGAANRSLPAQIPVDSFLPESDLYYEEAEFVRLGQVLAPFGARGEVRVEISTDNPRKRFAKGSRVFFRPPPLKGLLANSVQQEEEGLLHEGTVASTKYQTLAKGVEAWIIKFKEVRSPEQAEQLRNSTLHIPLKDRERLQDPDEFYVQDLVGCRVFLKDDSQYVGRVIDVYSGFGTYDNLLLQLKVTPDDIRNNRTRQCQIPFAKALCPTVDSELKQVVIDPPEGLLDNVTYKKMRPLTPEQQAERIRQLSTLPVPVLGQPLPATPTEPITTQDTTQASTTARAPAATSAARTAQPAASPAKTASQPAVPAAAAAAAAASSKPVASKTAAAAKPVQSDSQAGKRPQAAAAPAAKQAALVQTKPAAAAAKPAAAAAKPATQPQPAKPRDFVPVSSQSADDSDRDDESVNESESTGEASASDKWKLRRRLGVSLAKVTGRRRPR